MDKAKSTCYSFAMDAAEPTNRLVTPREVFEALKTLPGWLVVAGRLEKEFRFVGFARALVFVNKIVNPIEENQNYPKILITYDRVRVSLYTQVLGGLSTQDLAMAREMNVLW